MLSKPSTSYQQGSHETEWSYIGSTLKHNSYLLFLVQETKGGPLVSLTKVQNPYVGGSAEQIQRVYLN